MVWLKSLALFYTYKNQPSPYIGLVGINKIQTILDFQKSSDKFNSCDYYMSYCKEIDIFIDDTENKYEFFKFEKIVNKKHNYHWDYLHCQENFEVFNWKFNEEDNFFILDNFITGFVRKITAYSDTSNFENENQNSQLKPIIRIFNDISFEIEHSDNFVMIYEGMIHTKDKILTYSIGHLASRKKLTSRSQYDRQNQIFFRNQEGGIQRFSF
jgi:hypothetical protein